MSYPATFNSKPRTVQDHAARKCLIVEDDALISLDLQDIVTSHGVAVIDTAYTLTHALALAQDNTYDFALLDMHIGSHSILPVVDVLVIRKTPFAVVTGWDSDIPPALQGVPFAPKPFTEENILNILVRLLPSEQVEK